MLPHYPASAEWATVGGYVAARGSGVLSTRYGKIEDLVISLRLVTPTGDLVDTLPLPRHAVGPDIAPLFIGSEGSLGVITRVRLQLAPLPAARHFGVGVLPFFPLANGLLTGKVRRGQDVPANSRLAEPRRAGYVTDAKLDRVEALIDWGKEQGVSILEIAIGGLAAQPGCSSVIAGATSAILSCASDAPDASA